MSISINLTYSTAKNKPSQYQSCYSRVTGNVNTTCPFLSCLCESYLLFTPTQENQYRRFDLAGPVCILNHNNFMTICETFFSLQFWFTC